MFKTAEAWLRQVRASNWSGLVTYRRGTISNMLVLATQGQTTGQTDTGEIIIDYHAADWLIDREHLTLHDVLVEPLPGDLIDLGYGHGAEIYVVSANGNEPCWRWHGRDGGTYRIHSVRLAAPRTIPSTGGYLRPASTDFYVRPDGVSTYGRPA